MQHRQHMMSAAAHTLVWSGMQLNNTMSSVCGFGGVVIRCLCDGVGEGGKQSSKSIQECFRGTNL